MKIDPEIERQARANCVAAGIDPEGVTDDYDFDGLWKRQAWWAEYLRLAGRPQGHDERARLLAMATSFTKMRVKPLVLTMGR